MNTASWRKGVDLVSEIPQWILWIAATTVAGFVGGLLWDRGWESGGIWFGALVGATQWLILRSSWPRTVVGILVDGIGWVGSLFAGMTGTFLLGGVFVHTNAQGPFAVSLVFLVVFLPVGILLGLSSGLARLICLRPYIARPRLWLVVHVIIGMVFAAPVVGLLVGEGVIFQSAVVVNTCFGLSYGIATAIALRWKRPERKSRALAS